MGDNFGCMMVARRCLILGVGFRGQALRWRHSRFRGSKGRYRGNHFSLSIIWGAHLRHLANTTEPSICGGDAALCQITFTTCYHSRY